MRNHATGSSQPTRKRRAPSGPSQPDTSRPAKSPPATATRRSVRSTYRRVRADIVYGRLAPGQKLTLERMRGAYGSAVSTLREIFNGLASEGLITAEGARGFEVAAISPREPARDRRHAPASRMRCAAQFVRSRRRGVGGARRRGPPQAGHAGEAHGRGRPRAKRRSCGATTGNSTTRSFQPAVSRPSRDARQASTTNTCAT